MKTLLLHLVVGVVGGLTLHHALQTKPAHACIEQNWESQRLELKQIESDDPAIDHAAHWQEGTLTPYSYETDGSLGDVEFDQ